MRESAGLLVSWCALAACGDNVPARADASERDADASFDGAVEAQPLRLVRSWGGLGTAPGQFVEPSSIELDSAGFVYVAGHEDRFQKFTSAGELVDIYGTSGAGDGQFSHPHGLAIDRARGDTIFIGDQENGRVQVFSSTGTFLRRWTDPQFQHIHDVGIDPSTGDIYVGDYEQDVLQRFTSTGALVAEIGGPGTGPGQFDGVWGVSTDRDGNVYLADTFNRRVQKLSPSGASLGVWTSYGGRDFVKPTGVFVDAQDVVHVCDSLAETIVRFDRDGTFLESWALRPVLGEATEPEDLVIDATGQTLYVTEVRNHRVYQLERIPAPY